MAAALEQFVNNVRTLSSQGNLKQLVEYLNKSVDVLSKNQQHLDNVLQTLDLQQHSLGMLAILLVKFNAVVNSPDTFESLFAQFQEFVSGCNGEHVRFAADSFAELCHVCTQTLTERKEAMRGIAPIREALKKLQIKESQLTSIHADLCQLCLLARTAAPALEILEIDIDDINRENGNIDPKFVLLYYYYGGMIYATLKEWDKALFMLAMCITTPAMAVSHIMLEAYKKHMVISLIRLRKIQVLPKYTSSVVNRFFKHLALPYHELANAFAQNDPAEFQNVISRHTETFTRDQNMGLVKQCVRSLHRKNIQRLTMTFMTLSLQDMANRVKLSGAEEAEKYVLEMIQDGEIFASINQKDGMVVFHTNPENYESVGMLNMLKQQMDCCMALESKVQEMNDALSTNPDFIRKMAGLNQDDDPGVGGVGPSGSASASSLAPGSRPAKTANYSARL